MKSLKYTLFLFSILLITAIACNKDETQTRGTVALVFNHTVDTEDLNIRNPGDQIFDFMDLNGQEFNISKFGYYISDIKFSGPEVNYADPVKITVDATKLTGFYQVLESDPSSKTIKINEVIAGDYNKISFTIGVKFYTFIDGPAGGILDPANGAWFLNMEAGYVNLAIEGNAANSGQMYVDRDPEPDLLAGSFSFQLSGWRNILPEPGQGPSFFIDNTKTIELDLDELLSVEDGLNPEAHINIDLGKILQGVDFSQTYLIERPDQSQSIANNLIDAITLDFIR